MPQKPRAQGTWLDGTKWQYYPLSEQHTSQKCEAVFGIHIHEDQILLTQNQRGWDIPGGRIEKGESTEQALKRELLEECGFKINSSAPIGYLKLELIDRTNPMIVKGFMVEGAPRLGPVTAEECTTAKYISLECETVKNSQKYKLIKLLTRNCRKLKNGS